ncbi:serine/threonine-protein kinase [Marinobacter sp. SS21]|uniref:serine/threonine-protein kinase n=1 Tax=Marinobacter sp. SS21 TaxID=2979460 RepID=UPI00232EB9FF|nr:serine/threonine-protein kinase [Marinobacter sp. SS21]MDC0664132.1 serine/threonine-protein kinase [Marinobacter sp. SS21]
MNARSIRLFTGSLNLQAGTYGVEVLHVLLSRIFSLRLVVVAFALAVVLAADAMPWLGQSDRLLLELMPPVAAERAPVQPVWSEAVTAVAVLAGSGFLVAVVPMLGPALALLLTLVLAVGLVVTQVALLWYWQTWLPLGPSLVFLVLGFGLMLFWMPPQRDLRRLRANVQRARVQLGELLLHQGRPDEALAALAECPSNDASLALQYDIAIQQERRRQYDRAQQTLAAIQARRKQYRDVPARMQALANLTSAAAGAVAAGHDGARTLVLPELALSQPVLGRYEIERELGRGAMGVVYLGRDPKIARTVAIKTLSYAQYEPAELQELKARFFREAKAAGRLNHPAIVTVYDVGEEADLAFIAMDYAPGRALSHHGKPDTLLPLAVVLKLMATVAEALEYAHNQKIVHRDIKPGNLIYDARSGQLKITDFGIAKITDDSRTRTGSVMGSPLYMSPEQLRGQKVTGATDIYSLGVTLYKLVSGETPHTGDTLAGLTYQILYKRPRSVKTFNPDLPPGVVRLINKAIQQEPGKRFASAGAMAEALRRAGARIADAPVVRS